MAQSRVRTKGKLQIGWREWAALPELGVESIKAKIDTGARTSAIHAWNVEPFARGCEIWLRFELHPIQRSKGKAVSCQARAIDERAFRTSSGQVERRYVIETLLRLGDASWTIELALANRDQMGFRMLLGRTALRARALILPSRSYLAGPQPRTPRKRPRLVAAEQLGKGLP